MVVADHALLGEAYHKEEDGDVKERVLLVMRVRSDGIMASEACRELHRTKGWASKWIRRFDEEGIEGLKTRERSGRPMKLDHREFVSIRRKVLRNK
jgi:transposase